MLLLPYEINDKCSIHPIFQITRKNMKYESKNMKESFMMKNKIVVWFYS